MCLCVLLSLKLGTGIVDLLALGVCRNAESDADIVQVHGRNMVNQLCVLVRTKSRIASHFVGFLAACS